MFAGAFCRMGNDPSSMPRADTSAHSVQRRGVSSVPAEKRKDTHTQNNSGHVCLRFEKYFVREDEKTHCFNRLCSLQGLLKPS